MSEMALPGSIEPAVRRGPDLTGVTNPLTMIIFGGVIAAVLLFVAYSIWVDVDASKTHVTSYAPFIMLFVALLIALGFEFVNGFHDTANAVATVIYTHSLPPNFAVVWSGTFNFLGVLASSGAVAFGIVSLLPVELILQVGSGAGFAKVFALLIAAILWNLSTWYFGLPSSSSHTLIGSIMGVGLMNQLMAGSTSGTSGVDWSQAAKIGESLLLSPLVGRSGAVAVVAQCDLRLRRDRHEPGHLSLVHGAVQRVRRRHRADENQHDEAHALLPVVGAVRKTHSGAGQHQQCANQQGRRRVAFGFPEQRGHRNERLGDEHEECRGAEADQRRK